MEKDLRQMKGFDGIIKEDRLGLEVICSMHLSANCSPLSANEFAGEKESNRTADPWKCALLSGIIFIIDF